MKEIDKDYKINNKEEKIKENLKRLGNIKLYHETITRLKDKINYLENDEEFLKYIEKE